MFASGGSTSRAWTGNGHRVELSTSRGLGIADMGHEINDESFRTASPVSPRKGQGTADRGISGLHA